MGLDEKIDPDLLRNYSIAFFWLELFVTACILGSQILHINNNSKLPDSLRGFQLYDESIMILSAQHMKKKLYLDVRLKLYDVAIWTVVISSEFIPFVCSELQLADSDFDFTPDFFDYEIRSSISFAFWFSLFELVILDFPKKFFKMRLNAAYGFYNKSKRHWLGVTLDETLMETFQNTIYNFLLAFFIQFYDQHFQNRRPSVQFFILLATFVAVKFVLMFVYIAFEIYERTSFVRIPEGDLKNKIAQICANTGYPMSKVFIQEVPPEEPVNAYCISYFGLIDRITLLSNIIGGYSTKEDGTPSRGLSTRELEGIFAHEVGHKMRYHLEIRHLVNMFILEPIQFGLSIWFREQLVLYTAFGFRNVTQEPFPILPGLFLAQFIALRALIPIMDFVNNIVTRFTEADADLFSILVGVPRQLQEGLVRLKYLHLGFPTSSWMYTLVYDHHATLVDRIDHISKNWKRH